MERYQQELERLTPPTRDRDAVAKIHAAGREIPMHVRQLAAALRRHDWFAVDAAMDA